MYQSDYQFSVYIMASPSGTLYTGMTNNLQRRVHEHKTGFRDGFAKKYGCTKLVYFEYTEYVLNAIKRETQIKGWNRKKKEALIRRINPCWKDLSAMWALSGNQNAVHIKPMEC